MTHSLGPFLFPKKDNFFSLPNSSLFLFPLGDGNRGGVEAFSETCDMIMMCFQSKSLMIETMRTPSSSIALVSTQHAFNVKCMQTLKGEGATWTLYDCLVSSLVASKALYPRAFQKILVHQFLLKTVILYVGDTMVLTP